MTAEVTCLLDRAVMEASSCESKQSSLEKITTAAVSMSPPQKSQLHQSTHHPKPALRRQKAP